MVATGLLQLPAVSDETAALLNTSCCAELPESFAHASVGFFLANCLGSEETPVPFAIRSSLDIVSMDWSASLALNSVH